MRGLKFVWILVFVAAMFVIGGLERCYADLTWDTPIGTVGLPLQSTEAVLGFDAILRQSIAGVSVPVWVSPLNLFSAQVGAVGAWPNNGATVEPYVAAGIDILREIPKLQDFSAAHLNVFGRWASEQGKAGLGVSFSYSFAAGPVVTKSE